MHLDEGKCVWTKINGPVIWECLMAKRTTFIVKRNAYFGWRSSLGVVYARMRIPNKTNKLK